MRPALLPILVVLFLTGSALAADPFSPSLAGKKLISYGSDWPNPAYCRQNIHEMEKRPFNGIVIVVSKQRQPQLGGDSDGFKVFGKQPLKFEDYAGDIDDLRHSDFKKFTDNFIVVEAQPGDVDWFNDADFKTVVNNFRVMARVAKQANCVGIEFDPEEYSNHVFTPRAWPDALRDKHTLDECIAMAKKRGQEVMRAINEEFPGIKILSLFGPSMSIRLEKPENNLWRLLAPFLEGMASVASPGAQIIDAYELAYGFKTEKQFQDGRQEVLNARSIFTDKPTFDRVMRVGFGLWLDNKSGELGWHPDAPAKNYYQPATWQTTVHFAAMYSDEYVWIWHEQLNFWTGKNVNEAYIKSMSDAVAPGK